MIPLAELPALIADCIAVWRAVGGGTKR